LADYPEEGVDERELLRRAVEDLHGCRARFLEEVPVTERFAGRTIWQGTVSVFSVDHADADTCYAWGSPIEGSERKKIYAVLKKPPVDGPLAAVRASVRSRPPWAKVVRSLSLIRWKRQWGGGDRVVWISVRKLNEGWKKDPSPGYYIPLGNCIEHRFGEWLNHRSPHERVWMPHISLCGIVSFTDGRHRFAWCRDHGVKAMPVSVASKREAEMVKRLFGSASRVCRMPCQGPN
jgi:hypothetical protein